MRLLILAALLLAIAASCGPPKPEDENYASWVRDYKNGMHVRQEQNDLAFDLQYQPAEFLWIQRNGSYDAKRFESQQQGVDDLQYFVLNIYSSDGRHDVIAQRSQGDEQLSKELLYYFSYRFQNDISIENGGERQPCALFHYEQHGTKSFVLGFPKGEKSVNEVTFLINSPVLDSIPVRIKIAV